MFLFSFIVLFDFLDYFVHFTGYVLNTYSTLVEFRIVIVCNGCCGYLSDVCCAVRRDYHC
jgi:hypothetical protein